MGWKMKRFNPTNELLPFEAKASFPPLRCEKMRILTLSRVCNLRASNFSVCNAPRLRGGAMSPLPSPRRLKHHLAQLLHHIVQFRLGVELAEGKADGVHQRIFVGANAAQHVRAHICPGIAG